MPRGSVLQFLLWLALIASGAAGQSEDREWIEIPPETKVEAAIDEVRAQAETGKATKCRPLSGALKLGGESFALVIHLSETLEPLDPEKDPGAIKGECHYEANGVASAQIETGDLPGGGGAFKVKLPLRDLDFFAYIKEYGDAADPAALTEVGIAWSDNGIGDVVFVERWGIRFLLYSLGATFAVNDSGQLEIIEGSLELQMDLEGTTQLHGPVYLGGNVSSLIRYEWNDKARSWSDGSWHLDGMGAVKLEIRRDGIQPIASMELALNADGDIDGELKLEQGASWDMGGFRITMESCSVRAFVSLRTGEWAIRGGSLRGSIQGRAPLTSELRIALDWKPASGTQRGNFGFRLETDTVPAFGGELRNLSLEADLIPSTLTLTRIAGSVEFHYAAFSEPLKITEFEMREGELRHFSGSGGIEYKGFAIHVRELRYLGNTEQKPAHLSLSASLNLGWGAAGAASIDFKKFEIGVDGTIAQLEVSGAIAAAPVDINFSASLGTTQFEGRFSGKMAGTMTLGGSIVIGRAPEGYRYGALTIQLRLGRGVPIGNTGLKLIGLSGGFGCNYVPAGAPFPVGPTPNSYYLQAGLTIGDMAGLASLSGSVSVVLGQTNAIGLVGIVQVTQATPYFVGMVSASYQLGTGSVSGTLLTTVKIPQNGSIVRIDQNVVGYRIDGQRWSVDGRGLGGTLFGFLRLHGGTIALRGSHDRPLQTLEGSISGRMSGSRRVTWAYPSGFKPWGNGSGGDCSAYKKSGLVADCDCADDTDNAIGFGIAGSFAMSVSGSVNARLKRLGIEGNGFVEARFDGSVGVKWPGTGWFSDCAKVASMSGSGRLDYVSRGGTLRLTGKVRFVDPSGDEYEAEFDQTFD